MDKGEVRGGRGAVLEFRAGDTLSDVVWAVLMLPPTKFLMKAGVFVVFFGFLVNCLHPSSCVAFQ